MAYYGSWKINDTLTFVCNTHNPTNGMATAADAVPTYHVYEDETATPIITGSMAALNSPNAIGFYSEQITLSAANGVEKGKSYNIYIRAVVAGVTGTMAHFFQIEAEVDANVVSDKTGYSLSSPQTYDRIGYTSGTMTSVLNVVNPVTASSVTGNVGGNVVGSVGSVTLPVGINTGTFLSAAADAVWDEAISGHLTAGSTGEKLNGAGSAGDPWGTPLPGSYVAGQAGYILASRMPTGTVIVSSNQDKTGYSLSSPQAFDLIGNISGTLTNVRNILNPVTAGIVTGSVLGNVNGSVASVTAPVTVGTNNDKTGYSLSSPQNFNLIGNISGTHVGNQLGYVGMVTGSVNSVVQPVTVGTNNDKTGYGLSNNQVVNFSGTITNVYNVLNPVTVGTNNDKTGYGLTNNQVVNFSGTITNVYNVLNPVTAGVVTGSVLGNVNGSVGSVTNPVGLNTGTIISAIADGVWDETLAGHLSAGSAGNALNGAGSAGDPWTTPLPGAYGPGTAGNILASRMPTGTVLVGDKTGFSLSSPQSFNLIGNISGTITNVTNVQNPVSLVTGTYLSNLAYLDVAVSSRASQTSLDTLDDYVDTEVAAIKAKTDNLPTDPADASDIAASFTTVNSKLDAIDDYVDTEVAAVLAAVDTEVGAIKTKTDQLTFTSSGKVDATLQAAGDIVAAVANKIADHIWRRTYANIRGSSDGDAVSFRSPLGMLAKLVNKWSISGTTLTVKHEDDSTTIGTQTLTGTAGADPITQVDTDG